MQATERDHLASVTHTRAPCAQFWDTMAGQQEAQGAVQVDLAINDLLSSQPEYTTGFRSGAEGFRAKEAKGNLPSQSGGIFGGGSYQAEAEGLPSNRPAAPMPPQSQAGGTAAQQSSRPKGNQSSVQGGIFAPMEPTDAPPPSSRSNRSNKSSIEGGIFGSAGPVGPPQEKKFNSNRSSIEGGIFG